MVSFCLSHLSSNSRELANKGGVDLWTSPELKEQAMLVLRATEPRGIILPLYFVFAPPAKAIDGQVGRYVRMRRTRRSSLAEMKTRRDFRDEGGCLFASMFYHGMYVGADI